jgi:multidrug efflux pump subunit AcrB
MWLIIFGGAYTWMSLIQELFPNSDPEKIQVSLTYPGATPEEIEKLVTRPVETELIALDDVKEIHSQVLEGLSIVSLELEKGASIHHSLGEVRTAMDRISPDLPGGVEEPQVAEFRPQFPVITVLVHGNSPEMNLRRVAKKVQDELLDMPEISEVFPSGIREREIWIEILPHRLEAFGVTLSQIGEILRASNLDLPGGQLKSKLGNIRVRTLGERNRALEIEDLVIRGRSDGTIIRLSEVAIVRETFEDRVIRGRFKGEPAVALTVFKTPEQDATKIARRVREYVHEKKEQLGGGAQLDTMNDLADLIVQRIDLMLDNGGKGLLYVVLVLAIFLEIRVAFWVAIGIPISFLGTFVLMDFMGGTINLISLFGLILVLGIIVDDAIVIGENVHTRMRSGMNYKKAAVLGTNEVAIPVLAAVLTSIIAFLPMAFIEGNMGVMMGVMPVVVIAALSTSLIEAFAILPCHLAHMSTTPLISRIPYLRVFASWVSTARAFVFETFLPTILAVVLRFLLFWRYVTAAAFVCILVATFGLIQGGVVPFQILQDIDGELITVDLEMAAGTPEERTMEIIQRIERIAKGQKEIEKVFSCVGISFGDEGRITPADPSTVGQLIIQLFPADTRLEKNWRSSKDILAELRAKTRSISGVRQLKFEVKIGGPAGSDIEARIEGKDLRVVEKAIGHVRNLLQDYEGVSQIIDDLKRGKMEVRLKLKEQGRLLGLTTQQLALQLRHGFFGYEVQEIQEEDDRITLRVLLPRSARGDLVDLENIRISTPSGGRPILEEVATLETVRGFGMLHRVDGKRSATIRAEVDETKANTARVTQDLEFKLTDIHEKFPGVQVVFGGAQKSTSDSLGSLAVGFSVALFGIYSIIAILFRSYLQPLIVMAAIPFSLVGAVLGHLHMGYPFTIMSLVGYVALAGVVVNDSLILVDFINRSRRKGIPLVEAAIGGSRDRFRAILLTSVTTVAGLGPLLMEKSYQAQFLIPMAISIVYGLSFATILTLLLIPTIYTILGDFQRTTRWLITGIWTERVTVRCSCGKTYRAAGKKAGKFFQCLSCSARLQVPRPGQSEDLDDMNTHTSPETGRFQRQNPQR